MNVDIVGQGAVSVEVIDEEDNKVAECRRKRWKNSY